MDSVQEGYTIQPKVVVVVEVVKAIYLISIHDYKNAKRV
jgi:hypothetical protein